MHQLLVPQVQFTKAYLALVVAVLGTTISPYLFFWQSAHRIEELRDEPEGGNDAIAISELSDARAHRKQRTSRLDVFSGMALSQLVMFAVIVSTAVTLHAHGQTDVTSAAQAAQALKPIAGSASSLLFALGFIGSGMLAVPVLAGAGSAGVAGLLGRPWGFSRSPRKAPVFYGLVAVGTIGGTLLTLVHVNPITLLVVVAVINGIAAAPFLAIIMIIAANREIMGDYRNGRVAQSVGWFTVAVMGAAAVAMLATGGL
jgi:Mn2+/Fe2+ NRAMP family transporter